MFNRISILIVFLTLFSCTNNTYCPQTEINVPLVLQEIRSNENDKYCLMVFGSIKGERESIAKLIALKIEKEKYIPLHGEVLIRIIHFLNEEKFLTLIDDFNQMEISKLFFYVRIGFITIKDKEFKGKRMENVFPILSEFLEENI